MLDRRVSIRTVLLGIAGLVGVVALVVAASVVVRRDDTDTATTTDPEVVQTITASTADDDTDTGDAPTDEVVLLPDGLGVVDFGASAEETLASLTEALGEPDFTQPHGGPEVLPAEYRCVGSAAGTGILQAVWGERLVVLSSDDAGFFAWRFVTAPDFVGDDRPDSELATPEGLGQGATVEDFERAYGPSTTGPEMLLGELVYLGEGPAEYDGLTMTVARMLDIDLPDLTAEDGFPGGRLVDGTVTVDDEGATLTTSEPRIHIADITGDGVDDGLALVSYDPFGDGNGIPPTDVYLYDSSGTFLDSIHNSEMLGTFDPPTVAGDTLTFEVLSLGPTDPRCCPTVQTTVAWRWNGTEFVPA